jgi:citrate synthase
MRGRTVVLPAGRSLAERPALWYKTTAVIPRAEETVRTMSDAVVNPLKAGLEDVVVSPSDICFIDGHEGRLVYRGFNVDDLAAQSSFEEVTYLLWYGKLPTRKELDAHVKALS